MLELLIVLKKGYYHLHKFDRRYTQIIETACEENPIPEKEAGKRGRPKKGKVITLIERLKEYKAGICLFIKNFAVPFDNNQAERDVRMVKVKTKVSGCFRTEAGAEDYLRIMSYVGTAKKHGIIYYLQFLLIKEKSLWSVPGGWCAYNLSPAENAIKEAKEK